MQPIAFLREVWKKWEQKCSAKRNVPVATLNYIPSPRRAKTFLHRRASNTSGLSHKWVTLKRHSRSSTVKESTSPGEQVTALTHNPHRDCHPASPLTSTISPGSQYSSHSEQDDCASDFHPHLGRNSCYSSSQLGLPSLRLLPTIEVNYGQDDVYNSAGFKLDQSSESVCSHPSLIQLSRPSIVEKSSTNPGVIVCDQTTRIASRTTRTAIAPPAKRPETSGTRHLTTDPKTKPSPSPKVYDGHTFVSPPEISTCATQSHDAQAHDFPLSFFPQPPPLLVRQKVPKPLVLWPARPSSSRSLLPYSPLGTPTSLRPGSLRSLSQTSFSSPTKKGFGRPLASVSPPPTSPPCTPLPIPPVEKRTDSNFLSASYPSLKAPGPVKYRPSTSGTIADRRSTPVGNTSAGTAQLYQSRSRNRRQSQPPAAVTL